RVQSYDPSAVEKAAARLYDRANSAIVPWVLFGVFLGVVGGVVLSQLLFFAFEDQYLIESVAVRAGAVRAAGFLVGLNRASSPRLQALTALWCVRIEKNTQARS